MAKDLTDSLYAMMVLAYGTLATTTYLFTTMETAARAAVHDINDLKRGPCSFIWDAKEQKSAYLETSEKQPDQEIREEFDTINSGKNMVVERWPWLQFWLFGSVAIPAILLVPVLLCKVDILDADSRIVDFLITFFAVLGQLVASAVIPCIIANLWRMRSKLTRIQRLRRNMAAMGFFPRHNGSTPPSALAGGPVPQSRR